MKKLKASPWLPASSRPEESLDQPVLRFTPTAWAKLLYFCHRGETEIGGFGISSSQDLLLIEDFVTVRQTASIAHVAFDDAAVADFFESQVDQGRKPEQFARLWLHTHPGDSPTPSLTDEETFERVFGACHWAIMTILARGGSTYARLRFNIGPAAELLIPVAVDYRHPFAGSNETAWEAEYQANIYAEPLGPEPGAQAALEDETMQWLKELDLFEDEKEVMRHDPRQPI